MLVLVSSVAFSIPEIEWRDFDNPNKWKTLNIHKFSSEKN